MRTAAIRALASLRQLGSPDGTLAVAAHRGAEVDHGARVLDRAAGGRQTLDRARELAYLFGAALKQRAGE